MKIIDLTLPMREDCNYYVQGNLPWEVPFEAEYTVNEVGLKMGRIQMYCEPGTRFLCLPGTTVGNYMENRLPNLVMHDAVKLKIPKEPKEGGNFITTDEINDAIKRCPAKPGDAIVLNTGHGDNEKYYKLGPKWEPQSPCMHPDSVPALSGFLREIKASLFCYDTSNISWQCTDLCTLSGEKWAKMPNRPPLMSEGARKVTEWYCRSGLFAKEFQPLVDLLRITDAVGGLVNVGAIKNDRFKLIVAPFKLITWQYVPATCYAIEED